MLVPWSEKRQKPARESSHTNTLIILFTYPINLIWNFDDTLSPTQQSVPRHDRMITLSLLLLLLLLWLRRNFARNFTQLGEVDDPNRQSERGKFRFCAESFCSSDRTFVYANCHIA